MAGIMNIAKGMIGGIKAVVADMRIYANPIANTQLQRQELHTIRELLSQGEAELITVSHSSDKLKALAEELDKMWEHPICQNSGLRKPKLLLVKGTGGLPIRGGTVTAISPASAFAKYITIPEGMMENLSLAELKGFTAHEIGHHLARDEHARRGLRIKYFSPVHVRENFADKVAVVLTGESQSIAEGLGKAYDHQLRDIREATPGLVPWIERIERISSALHLSHPPVPTRIKLMQKTEARLQTSEGQGFVEREIKKHLEKQKAITHPNR